MRISDLKKLWSFSYGALPMEPTYGALPMEPTYGALPMEPTYGALKRVNDMKGINAMSIIRLLDRYGEASVQAIANELGCSENSVRTRIGTMNQCGIVACSGSVVSINSHAVKIWTLTEGFKNSAMYVAIVGATDQ